jgi:hypothetical protein
MTTPARTERPPSVWEDLLEIFYAPTAVFTRRRETPAFGAALIIFVILIVALSFGFRGMMEPIFDAEFNRGMAQAMKQNPKLTPEMVEQGRSMAKKFLYVAVGGYALAAPIVMGFLLWLVGKIAGSKADVGQMLMVGTYGMFPRVLESVVGAAQTLILPAEALKSRYAVQLGPARFLNPDTTNPLMLALLGRADVFTIWVTILFAIGLAVLGKIPKGSAAAVAALIWLIGAIPGIWGAVRAM